MFSYQVHILRITHFCETTKDRNLIFGMGGDANVKLCIQHFLSQGLSPTPLVNLFKKMATRLKIDNPEKLAA
jgi:type VI protein secretion system component VasA